MPDLDPYKQAKAFATAWYPGLIRAGAAALTGDPTADFSNPPRGSLLWQTPAGPEGYSVGTQVWGRFREYPLGKLVRGDLDEIGPEEHIWVLHEVSWVKGDDGPVAKEHGLTCAHYDGNTGTWRVAALDPDPRREGGWITRRAAAALSDEQKAVIARAAWEVGLVRAAAATLQDDGFAYRLVPGALQEKAEKSKDPEWEKRCLDILLTPYEYPGVAGRHVSALRNVLAVGPQWYGALAAALPPDQPSSPEALEAAASLPDGTACPPHEDVEINLSRGRGTQALALPLPQTTDKGPTDSRARRRPSRRHVLAAEPPPRTV